MANDLTPAQEADLIATRDEWLAIGRSTEPLDRDEAAAAVLAMYAEVGEATPRVEFHDSPRACQNRYAELSGRPASEATGHAMGGALWCAWEVHYDFARRLGAKYTEKQSRGLDLWLRQARALHIWFPYDEVVLISERPSVVQTDETGRLHSVIGPAIGYRDGWGVYAYQGVRIPGEWIDTPKDQLDASQALTWPNVEQRRCLAEIIGWDRVLKSVGSRRLQSDWAGELLEADLPDAPETRFARVRCGTGREFVLLVDSESRTCEEAIAKTYNVSVAEYREIEGRT